MSRFILELFLGPVAFGYIGIYVYDFIDIPIIIDDKLGEIVNNASQKAQAL